MDHEFTWLKALVLIAFAFCFFMTEQDSHEVATRKKSLCGQQQLASLYIIHTLKIFLKRHNRSVCMKLQGEIAFWYIFN